MHLFAKKKTPAATEIDSFQAEEASSEVSDCAELLRENKRTLDKAIRELDRERTALQTQEKKLIAEIKKTAKQGQMDAVKVMAKSLVRNRHAVTKMYSLKSQLQAVSLRMATLKSTQAMADAMRGATKAMGMMNKQLNMPALQKIMREFERQNERMEMTSEMMGDAIDDAFEGEDEEGETDLLVNEVLDEIGINLNNDLVSAPHQQHAAEAAASAGREAEPMGMGVGGSDGPPRKPRDPPRPPPGGGPPPPPPGGGGGGGGMPEPGSGIDDELQARLNNLRKS